MVTSTNEVQLNVEDKSQPTTNVTHPVLVRQIYSLQLPRMILGLLIQVHPIILDSCQLQSICPSSTIYYIYR